MIKMTLSPSWLPTLYLWITKADTLALLSITLKKEAAILYRTFGKVNLAMIRGTNNDLWPVTPQKPESSALELQGNNYGNNVKELNNELIPRRSSWGELSWHWLSPCRGTQSCLIWTENGKTPSDLRRW